jgi:hypothetical protein
MLGLGPCKSAPLLGEQVRQLGDIRRDAPLLIAGEQLPSRGLTISRLRTILHSGCGEVTAPCRGEEHCVPLLLAGLR